MSVDLINPIKDAMVAALQGADLGFKVVAKDIVVDNLADEVELLIPKFPAAIVNYLGATGVRDGLNLEVRQTYGVVIAARSVQDPKAGGVITGGKSDRLATELLGPVMNLFVGKNLVPDLQRDYFMWSGESLIHKDKVWTLYEQRYEATVVVSFRDALKAH
jgi:hypothetical protein